MRPRQGPKNAKYGQGRYKRRRRDGGHFFWHTLEYRREKQGKGGKGIKGVREWVQPPRQRKLAVAYGAKGAGHAAARTWEASCGMEEANIKTRQGIRPKDEAQAQDHKGDGRNWPMQRRDTTKPFPPFLPKSQARHLGHALEHVADLSMTLTMLYSKGNEYSFSGMDSPFCNLSAV
jgi:hypothetical protein